MTAPLSSTGRRESIRAERKQCLLGIPKISRERIITGNLFRIHIQHANPGYIYARQIDFQVIQPCNEINSLVK